MEIDYGILEEFNVNKEEALTQFNKSAQVNKYVLAICNNDIIKSIRTKKAKGLKELLRNIKDWNCSTCNIQLYSALNYNKHISSINHKCNVNGLENPIVCSMVSCRKKFSSNDQLEEHLQLSPKCIKSPTNKTKDTNIKEYKKWEKYYDNLKDNYGNMKQKWERQKKLYNLFTHNRETMTDLDKQDYNIMISEDYNGNEKYELVKDDLGFLIVKQNEKKINEELKQLEKQRDKEWDKREKEIEEEDRILAQKIEMNRQAEIIKAKILEQERLKKEEALLEEWKSNLRSDKFLGGYSSTSEEEQEVKEI